MELAKLTTKGQITIPAEIRKRLNVQAGDKVVFLEENGRIFIENAEKLKFTPDEHSGREGVAPQALRRLPAVQTRMGTHGQTAQADARSPPVVVLRLHGEPDRGNTGRKHSGRHAGGKYPCPRYTD